MAGRGSGRGVNRREIAFEECLQLSDVSDAALLIAETMPLVVLDNDFVGLLELL